MIGYTNAGKSTIMNALVRRFGENQEKTVFQADMLFATLETSVRKLNLPDKQSFCYLTRLDLSHIYLTD
ncbi:GTP-binding protein HflX [Weissella viridescens]|uniref:GTP-binding protein HflX n=1 Tax=Weissella viridescens TaxID=1629 RepID=A0A380NWR8_WEIVI|nr:GTP-binding protein HflX [Weissella viridescens]